MAIQVKTMQYRNNRAGEPISVLGYGCMRLTKKGRQIDLDKAQQEILKAVELGVNYFDTAYIYPGNEAALGEILARTGIRDKINLATKLPHYMVNSRAGTDRIFREELRRLQTDWIDYYLIHFLTDVSQWEKMKRLGIEEWIAAQKAEGKIRQIGFSFHGNTESFLAILRDYDWDFCMIQYNYMDVNAQAGREGLRAAAEKGIPVMIMEPLRGGKLVDQLPGEARERIRDSGCGYSPAELALRWLWDQPEVTCVLSGMNSLQQITENCRIAADHNAGAFDESMQRLVTDVRDAIIRSTKVGCTECGYCMPCPQGVDIRGTFRCYNRMFTENKRSGQKDYFQAIALRNPPAFAQQCNECGRCEWHCPQHIPIRQELKAAGKALMPPYLRAAVAVARTYLRLGKAGKKQETVRKAGGHRERIRYQYECILRREQSGPSGSDPGQAGHHHL